MKRALFGLLTGTLGLLFLALAALYFPAAAQQIEIGSGLICDTPEQAERFLRLHDEGKDPTSAVERVNDEANDPSACSLSGVAFIRGGEVKQIVSRAAGVSIVEILVVGIQNEGVLVRVAPRRQYTLFRVPSTGI